MGGTALDKSVEQPKNSKCVRIAENMPGCLRINF